MNWEVPGGASATCRTTRSLRVAYYNREVCDRLLSRDEGCESVGVGPLIYFTKHTLDAYTRSTLVAGLLHTYSPNGYVVEMLTRFTPRMKIPFKL